MAEEASEEPEGSHLDGLVYLANESMGLSSEKW